MEVTWRQAIALVGLTVAGLWLPAASAQPCEPHWSALENDMDNYVRAVLVYDDDGPGPDQPAVYAGGQFTVAGGCVANGIAKWDGAVWSPLGSGTQGFGALALAAFDDGTGPALYAGGSFSSAGGVPANNIAKWNGTSWSPLGSGTNDWVIALAVLDDDGPGPHAPALYVGGFFSAAGGVGAHNIAKWNGTSWSPLGNGLSNPGHVYALWAWDDDGPGPHLPALYVGGYFTTAGGVSAHNVAKWDGTSWSPLGSGLGNEVYAFTEFDDDGDGIPSLFVGGMFWMAGSLRVNSIARWDGSSWSALGVGMNHIIHALTVFDDDGPGPHPPMLYAGGYFTAAGGHPANYVAKWNGRQWWPLGSGTNYWVMALKNFDPDGDGPEPPQLITGGRFTSAGGIFAPRIAAWTSPCAFQGDMNCDSVLDALDIRAFMLAMIDPSAYAAAYPSCDRMLGDFNGDGSVDMLDLQPFLEELIGN
ncbi:MAG TPA: hypothetical protein VMV94_20380 [Phycisphaerae bacterium]|nr:hypothetical protein [Phycisphaerae bacterium]